MSSTSTQQQSILGEPYGDTSKAYPEVYNDIPPQPTEKKPGQLTQQQIQQFFDQGFLIVEDYLDTFLLEEVKSGLEKIVDAFANVAYKAGKIKDLYKNYGFFQRLTKLEEEFPGSSIIIHKAGYIPISIKKLWTNEKLINCMEQFLGTRDIQGNPVWNIRTKTPNNEATVVPWHQDCGYMDNDSHRVLQMTAWIPLLNSTAKNGCMQVIKGGHKKGQVVPHYGCWKSTHYIEMVDKEMEELLGVDVDRDTVTCEVPYGGVLFLSNIIPHRSLPNLSNDVRWSLDLRWQRMDQPVGFHGLSDGIQFSSSSDSDFKVNWDSFTGDSTIEEKMELITKGGTKFDTCIPGPWINKWKLVNKNKHVIALEESLRQPGKHQTSYHQLDLKRS